MTSEAKTGIVVLVVIALGIIAWAKLGGLSLFHRDYTVIVCFDDLHGLSRGEPVRLRGIDIGEVKDVGIEEHEECPGLPACATLSIERQYPLHYGDVFQIASGQLIGDRHIRVSEGGPGLVPLNLTPPPSVVPGSPPSGFQAMASQAEDIAEQVRRIMGDVEGVLGDPQVQRDLKDTLANLRVLSLRATDVATRALTLVERIGPDSAGRVNDLVENLYEISRSLRRTAAGVNALVSTSTLPQDMDAIAENLRATSESVQKTAAKVEEVATDPKTSSDIRMTLENVREATAAGSQAAQQATQVLDDVGRIVSRVERTTRGIDSLRSPLPNIEGQGALEARVGSGPAGRIDLNLDLYPDRHGDSFVRLGARDLGGEEKLDLQWGTPLSHRDENLRVGVIEGELGVGWDRRWSPRWSSEAEIIDLDRFRLDVRGRYRYSPDWDLVFGMDRVLAGSEPFVGARRHFDF